MMTIHRIQRAEPGTTIILGGDFNERLDEEENPMRKELLHSNMQVSYYTKESYHREGMEEGSKIDHILTPQGIKVEIRVVTTDTSDHNIFIAEVMDEKDQRKIKKMPKKEMFYSNLLNKIK